MSENIKCYSFSCLLMSLWCCSLTAWASDALNRYKYNGKELEHTHGIDSLDYRYSPDGAYDGKISQKMGTRPVFTMGHDNVVHGIIQNESQQSLFKLPVPFCSLDYLLNGGGMSFSKYVGQNNWKY